VLLIAFEKREPELNAPRPPPVGANEGSALLTAKSFFRLAVADGTVKLL
jgi:hypothetical protein